MPTTPKAIYNDHEPSHGQPRERDTTTPPNECKTDRQLIILMRTTPYRELPSDIIWAPDPHGDYISSRRRSFRWGQSRFLRCDRVLRPTFYRATIYRGTLGKYNSRLPRRQRKRQARSSLYRDLLRRHRNKFPPIFRLATRPHHRRQMFLIRLLRLPRIRHDVFHQRNGSSHPRLLLRDATTHRGFLLTIISLHGNVICRIRRGNLLKKMGNMSNLFTSIRQLYRLLRNRVRPLLARWLRHLYTRRHVRLLLRRHPPCKGYVYLSNFRSDTRARLGRIISTFSTFYRRDTSVLRRGSGGRPQHTLGTTKFFYIQGLFDKRGT